MNEEKRGKMTEAGIDMDDVMERFMGNEELLDRMLQKFLQDKNYGELEEAVAAKDAEKALGASHALKGISSNLSMMRLYKLLTKQVELFRSDSEEEAYALMPDIREAYADVTTKIKEL